MPAPDKAIRIWDLRALRDPERRADPSGDGNFLLATITDLQRGVICVRWSPNDGTFLAGADDRTVSVWKRGYAWPALPCAVSL